MKKTYSKQRTETEIEKIKRLFPQLDNIPLDMEATTTGDIVKIVTSNLALQKILEQEGFTER